MRNRIAFITIVLLLLCTPLFAGGWDSGGFFGSGILTMGYSGGGTSTEYAVTGDPDVSTSYAVAKKIMGGNGDQAGAIGNGIRGQIIKVILSEKLGSGNYVLIPTTKTGFSCITFNSAGDNATLLFIDNSTGWIILGETGTSITY